MLGQDPIAIFILSEFIERESSSRVKKTSFALRSSVEQCSLYSAAVRRKIVNNNTKELEQPQINEESVQRVTEQEITFPF